MKTWDRGLREWTEYLTQLEKCEKSTAISKSEGRNQGGCRARNLAYQVRDALLCLGL